MEYFKGVRHQCERHWAAIRSGKCMTVIWYHKGKEYSSLNTEDLTSGKDAAVMNKKMWNWVWCRTYADHVLILWFSNCQWSWRSRVSSHSRASPAPGGLHGRPWHHLLYITDATSDLALLAQDSRKALSEKKKGKTTNLVPCVATLKLYFKKLNKMKESFREHCTRNQKRCNSSQEINLLSTVKNWSAFTVHAALCCPRFYLFLYSPLIILLHNLSPRSARQQDEGEKGKGEE